MCNAYEYYEGFRDQDFDYYEHLGSVRPPSAWKKFDNIKSKKTDSSVGGWYDENVLVADILGNFGIDYNTMFTLS
ncbi:MAG: hypothetical protein ACKPKO_41065, partial [Candidatus Fonsibacter sp.]